MVFILQEDNVLLDKHNLVCQGPRDLIWIIVLYAYILLTQLIAVILAFMTRKVEIEILNDAKYVALIIYITSIIITIMIVCAILLSNYLNADAAVFGGLLYIFTTTVLMIVFIPKASHIYQNLYLELWCWGVGGRGGKARVIDIACATFRMK